MIMRILRLCAASVLLVASPLLPASERPIEEVVVTAKQPGPKLWRVTPVGEADDHELWILGVLSPLPKDLAWDSSSVEAVLADSDEILAQPGITVSANPLKLLTVAPSLWGIKKMPNKQTLQETVPADLYERWLVLKETYIGRNRGIERQRPIMVADELYRKAIDEAGLTRSSAVYRAIDKVVKKNKIPEVSTGIKRHIKSPRKAIKKFKRSQIDDVECFRKTVDRIEADLKLMRARAEAWAAGDLAALKALPFEDHNAACVEAVMASAFADEMANELELVDVEQRLRNNWLDAAEKALTSNGVTFATLPIEELLQSDGMVAGLVARGYVVTN